MGYAAIWSQPDNKMEEFSDELQSVVDQVCSVGLVFQSWWLHKQTGVKFIGNPVVMKQMQVSSKLIALFHIKQPFADRLDKLSWRWLGTKATHIFSTKSSNVSAIFQNRKFNIILANNFVTFWTAGLWKYLSEEHLLMFDMQIKRHPG